MEYFILKVSTIVALGDLESEKIEVSDVSVTRRKYSKGQYWLEYLLNWQWEDWLLDWLIDCFKFNFKSSKP